MGFVWTVWVEGGVGYKAHVSSLRDTSPRGLCRGRGRGLIKIYMKVVSDCTWEPRDLVCVSCVGGSCGTCQGATRWFRTRGTWRGRGIQSEACTALADYIHPEGRWGCRAHGRKLWGVKMRKEGVHWGSLQTAGGMMMPTPRRRPTSPVLGAAAAHCTARPPQQQRLRRDYHMGLHVDLVMRVGGGAQRSHPGPCRGGVSGWEGGRTGVGSQSGYEAIDRLEMGLTPGLRWALRTLKAHNFHEARRQTDRQTHTHTQTRHTRQAGTG
jgi:hypothetical protein|mmetsp:Transcript_12775/g.23206  ORF Transcript_12775/g.23206 Transcript_12775/m.23206 type:complete len:267 (+) Transcript_12775:1327-2127(+)